MTSSYHLISQPFNSTLVDMVINFVKGKTFDEVKKVCEENCIRVRELDTLESKNLYLLVLDEHEVAKRNETANNLQSRIDNLQEEINNIKAKERDDSFITLYKQLLEDIKIARLQLSEFLEEQVCKNVNTYSDFQLMMNGIILEKDTNRVVCLCQKRMYENMEMELPSDSFDVEYCEDGTVLRLYNYNGKWYTATRKCIDARYSYWSGFKNFDDMFWEIIESEKEKLLSTLSIDTTYFFIMKHVDNRIVVKNSQSSLVFLGSVNNRTMEENYDFPCESKHIISRTTIDNENLKNCTSVNEIVKMSEDTTKRGVIITTEDGQKYKFDFSSFLKVKELRGNTPYIRTRILELLKEKDTLKEFMELYSEYSFSYAAVMWQLENAAKQIHKTYIESHVKRRMIIDNKHLYYKVIKQLHNRYKETQKPIQYADVRELLEHLQPHILKTLLGWVN
jgi:hypothetical protein